MQGCTFISKHSLWLIPLLLFSASRLAVAADDRTQQSEEDDFGSTPYTEYGEFNDDAQEAEDMKFYQYGRLFGIQLGLGFSGATGNRGRLWEGGFPLIDVRTIYWFNFNFALDLCVTSFKHHYNVPSHGGATDVSMVLLGANFRYYFDTRDVSAPIAFANPFLEAGFGSYTLGQNTPDQGSTSKDSSFGISGGGGLEFTIKPRSTYFNIDARIHSVTFKDTYTSVFNVADAGNLPDLTGLFYTFSANFLFTW